MTDISWLLALAVLVLAAVCQVYKVKAERLAKEVLNCHRWIDEIIKALESRDDDQLVERLDSVPGKRGPVQ